MQWNLFHESYVCIFLIFFFFQKRSQYTYLIALCKIMMPFSNAMKRPFSSCHFSFLQVIKQFFPARNYFRITLMLQLLAQSWSKISFFFRTQRLFPFFRSNTLLFVDMNVIKISALLSITKKRSKFSNFERNFEIFFLQIPYFYVP